MTEVGEGESQVTNGVETQYLEDTQEDTQTEESQLEETQEVCFEFHRKSFIHRVPN